mgnify:CR=1 FL=1
MPKNTIAVAAARAAALQRRATPPFAPAHVPVPTERVRVCRRMHAPKDQEIEELDVFRQLKVTTCRPTDLQYYIHVHDIYVHCNLTC